MFLYQSEIGFLILASPFSPGNKTKGRSTSTCRRADFKRCSNFERGFFRKDCERYK